jgi:hypothetical protein
MPFLARLRKLPWGLLGLEFVVVVLGILGALAVDSWWADRADRRTETAYLIRLGRDLERTRDAFDEDLEEHRGNGTAIRTALEELRTEPDPAGMEAVVEGMRHADALDVLFPFHTTYEELVATGNLALISSDTLRQALAAYDREVRNNLDWDEWLEDLWFTTVSPDLYKHAIVSDISREDFQARIVSPSPFQMDVLSFYGNTEIWNVLTVKLDAEMGISGARERLLGSLEVVLSLTESELRSRGVQVP